MKLDTLSQHARVLTTERGAVLFSYRDPIAVRQGGQYYGMTTLSAASRDHLKAFLGEEPMIPVTRPGLMVTAHFVLSVPQ